MIKMMKVKYSRYLIIFFLLVCIIASIFNNKMHLTGTLSYLSSSGLSEFKNYGLLLGSSIRISNYLRLKLAASTKARTTTEGTEIANVALRLSMNYKF